MTLSTGLRSRAGGTSGRFGSTGATVSNESKTRPNPGRSTQRPRRQLGADVTRAGPRPLRHLTIFTAVIVAPPRQLGDQRRQRGMVGSVAAGDLGGGMGLHCSV